MLDEADQDTSLEYDEKEAYENFKQFYEDTLPEFRKAGTVVQFKVCCNHEPHLRGNVYVQYTSEEECAKAFALFNARWYASKQLSCEFSPVTKWKSAICGLFERNRCPRGKNCNFLHVYQNPRNEFNHRDDLSPGRTPHNGWGSERSGRDWRRGQSSRRRDLDRERSRERDWEQERRRKQQERDWSRERDDRRDRRRRRSKEREHSRERYEKREQKRRKRNYSSDEKSDTETESKHLSERLSPSVEKNDDSISGNKGSRHSPELKEKLENRKRKCCSSVKHSHKRKSKKKHKQHSKHKKKKQHNRSESDSSTSESNDNEN